MGGNQIKLAMAEMEFTGERMTTAYKSYGSIEHLHRYSVIQNLLKSDMTVLDVACGEGYGTSMISAKVKKVYGVDISAEAISHASDKYKTSNIEFIQASALEIPLPDRSIDLIVSFETLEHLEDHDMMLSELKRILKNEGTLVISTPDKNNYEKDIPNPFHVRELTFEEFKGLLNRYFSIAKFCFQKTIHGSLIFNENSASPIEQYEGNFETLKHEAGVKKPDFIIAFATDSSVLPPQPGNSLFDASSIFNIEYKDYLDTREKYYSLITSWKFKFLNRFLKIFRLGF